MHEKLTLGKQIENKIKRGGSLDFLALPDPAVELVAYRKPGDVTNVLDFEILEAERVKGIADCLNRWQGKVGTQVRAGTDPSPLHSLNRGFKELFGVEQVPDDKRKLAAVVGPWFYRATARLENETLHLNVQEEPGEETAFMAMLFTVDFTGLELNQSSAYFNATRGARWVSLRQLVAERGEDPSYLYWSTIALAVRQLRGQAALENLITYFPPGEYQF